MRTFVRASSLALPVLLAGCSPTAEVGALEPVCRIVQPPAPLPAALAETSGAAVSRRWPEVVWTHNDSGGEPVLYAVRPTGELIATVRVQGAQSRDWEDLAIGPCPAGSCLYIGDIGDNQAERDEITIYRVPEPDPAAAGEVRAEAFPVRYPGGPRDAEGLVALPSGELLVLSKGRSEDVALYRYPLPLRPDEAVELERVATLSRGAQELPRQVTGASASPGGEWIAVRGYASLSLYRTEALLRGDTVPALAFDLRGLNEPQGEAVALLDDGRVVLTSEARDGAPALITALGCGEVAER